MTTKSRTTKQLAASKQVKYVKQVLAEHAARAFSDVCNEVFPLAAAARPHGSAMSYTRWYLEAMRAELEARESTPEGRYALQPRAR